MYSKIGKNQYRILLLFYLLVINFVFIAQLFGDNLNYYNAYQGCKDNGISIAFINYLEAVGSYEPVVFLLMYISSKFLNYEYFIFITNFCFMICFKKIISLYFNNVKYFIFLFLTDYYLLRFLCELHRLKIAFIFLILFFLTNKKKFIILSIFSHLQIFIFIIIKMIKRYIEELIKLYRKFTINISFLIISLSSLVPLLVMNKHIIKKINAYFGMYLPLNCLILGLLYFLLISITKNKSEIYFYLFLVVTVFSIFFGEKRLFFMIYEFILYRELLYFKNTKKVLNFSFICLLTCYNLYRIFRVFLNQL